MDQCRYKLLYWFQGKDYELTTLLTLEVEVKNEEPLWVCKEKSTDQASADFSDKAIITMNVIDANDPPEFGKNPAVLYQNEEEKPGKVLFTPEVLDADSALSNIRLVFSLFLHCVYSPSFLGFAQLLISAFI